MTPEAALSFIREHGVVLVSAKGPAPRMTEVIAGEPIKGSWWAHPKGREIFRVLQAIEASPDVLVCRVVGGKVGFVHRRLWPALIAAAGRFPIIDLAKTEQVHTETGRHIRRDTPFPQWANAKSVEAAKGLSEAEGLAALGEWAQRR